MHQCSTTYIDVKLFILLIAVLGVWPACLTAQRIDVKHFTMREGLATNNIQTIFQTRDGFIWLGTRGRGLSRFDGSTSTSYTIGNGLRDDTVNVIFEDSQRNIWIASSAGGVAQLKEDSVIYEFPNNLINQTVITAIAEASDGSLWFGTRRNGMFAYRDEAFQHLTTTNGLPDNTVWDFLKTGKHETWIATDKGVVKFDGEKVTPIDGFRPYSSIPVYQIFEDKNETKWLATNKGILKVDDGEISEVTQMQDIELGKISEIVQDGTGDVLVDTKDNGIFRFYNEGAAQVITGGELGNSQISDLYLDKESRIWIATVNNGVYLILNKGFTRYGQKSSDYSFGQVYAVISAPEGHVWLGTESGLGVFDSKSREVRYVGRPNRTKAVWDISLFSDGDLLVLADDNSLYRYDGTSFSAYLPGLNISSHTGQIFDVFLVDDRHIMLGTERGLLIIDDGKIIPERSEQDLRGAIVWHIMQDSKGAFWLSTSQGLWILDGGQLRKPKILDQEGVEKYYRYTVEGPYGDIWMGTNEGIMHYHRSANPAGEYVETFNNHDGLLTVDTQFLIFDDDSQLWHGTSAGLQKLDIEQYRKSGDMKVIHYGLTNNRLGLSFKHNAVTRDGRNTLWFGSSEGFVAYDPKADVKDEVGPPVHITDIKLSILEQDGQQYSTSLSGLYKKGSPPVVPLSHYENSLSFEFKGLDYQAPERLVYQYKLAGYSDEWSEVTKANKIAFSNLQPGNYSFMVKARDVNEVWSMQPAVFSFDIAPSFWRTNWFYGMIVLMCIGLFIGTAKLWLNTYEKRKLEQLVFKQTKDLRQGLREKEVLLAEVHHRVKNNLAVIISLIELQKETINEPLAKRALLESQMRIHSIAMIHEKLYQNDTLARINFSKYINELVDIISKSYNFDSRQISVDTDIVDIGINLDQSIPCGLILNELLCNAYEHAFRGRNRGKIFIELKDQDDLVHFKVADDGIGLPEEDCVQNSASLGLTLVHTLTRQLKGELTVESNDMGTSFYITFQKADHHKGHLV